MGTPENTIFLYKAIDAIRKDQQNQVRSGARKKVLGNQALQEKVNKMYPGGNKTSIKQGYGFGRRLSSGEELPANYSLTTKRSLEDLFTYLFKDKGHYDWKNTKSLLSKPEQKDYAVFLEIEPIPQCEVLNKASNNTIYTCKVKNCPYIADITG